MSIFGGSNYYTHGFIYSGNTMPTGCNYSQCRCTWTVCQCMPQWWPQTYVIETAPPTKQEAHKRRMESIPRRVSTVRPMRMKAPSVRPSVQALSIRIR